MGLLNLLRRKSLSASPAVLEALRAGQLNPYRPLGGTNQQVSAAYQRGLDASYGWIYSTQPAVRSVIDFIARNTAQLGLKLYERVGDTERQRREDHPAAQTMAHPDATTPADAFIYRLVTDYLIWDNAYFLKFRSGPAQKLVLARMPPGCVTVSGGRFTADAYWFWRDDGSWLGPIAPSDVFHWYGYNPNDPLLGLSKLETLRQELATDRANQAALVELAKSGLKGGYIERPLEAPEWDQGDADRFAEAWRAAKMRGDGRDPILEEGMKFVETGVSPKDAELLASRKFTKEEVASLYGVPMEAMGISEGTPNTPESRRLVYADVLPPITGALACQLDVDILQAEYGESDYYFEFDLNSKLQGQPEVRFPAMTAAAGGPWMTRDEVRARENLPPLPGGIGGEIILPLNVIEEGPGSPALPAPNVMPPQDANKPPQDGSYRETPKALNGKAIPGAVPEDHRLEQLRPRLKADMARQRRNISEIQGLLLRFYQRQAKTLKSKALFDSERWNTELAKDLHDTISRIVEREGSTYVGRLGGEDFDMRQVSHYLEAMAQGTAEGLNKVTQRDLESGTPQDAIDRAMNERAAIAGANIGARATAFARREAAKQSPTPHLRMQTWIADTARHGDLDGVSVPLDSDWGGISPGSEPNCACGLSIA